ATRSSSELEPPTDDLGHAVASCPPGSAGAAMPSTALCPSGSVGRLVPTANVGLADSALPDLMGARIEAGLGRLAPGSRGQYRRTLRLFATWAAGQAADDDALNPTGAVGGLLRAGPLVAATVVEQFLTDGCAGRAPATVAQRLAAIRWAVRLAREAGLVPWELHVRGPRVTAYR